MRLDKLLEELQFGSRKTVKRLIRGKQVTVDGIVTLNESQNVDAQLQMIKVKGQLISHKTHVYYMLNKPKGVVSAVSDASKKTVIDLIEPQDRRPGLYPVGRLDGDTEGLLLLTDNGQLGYQLIRPNKEVAKCYEVKVNGLVSAEDCAKFKDGIVLQGGIQCKPAKITVLAATETESHVFLTIQEGKFHQVKKMFLSVGKKVTALKRQTMGPLRLDPQLPLGAYRSLTREELQLLLPYFFIEKQQTSKALPSNLKREEERK
ncbi:16S rRNA pseudouridine(516) synthase [Enterococcus faecalis]|uniref:16S rRNA pseudouridine(516) synthase n=1 Tax=Enterococcus faecalis TaxID=1351 RepID=UPI003B7AEF0E